MTIEELSFDLTITGHCPWSEPDLSLKLDLDYGDGQEATNCKHFPFQRKKNCYILMILRTGLTVRWEVSICDYISTFKRPSMITSIFSI